MQTLAPPIALHGIIRVLVIDEAGDTVRTVREALVPGGDFHVHGARNVEDACELLGTGAFDIALLRDSTWEAGASVLLADYMRETQVVLILSSLKSSPEALAGIASTIDGESMTADGYLAGELTYLHDEYRGKRRRETMARWLEREAGTDGLTGLRNRRAFTDYLSSICTITSPTPVGVIVANVVGTSGVNQAYGMETGDAMLRRAASAIVHCLRAGDIAARIGGDDFAIAIENCDIDLARRIARRIVHEIERLNASDWADDIPLNLTFGVASGTGCSSDALLNAARTQVRDAHAPRTRLLVHANGRDDDGPIVA